MGYLSLGLRLLHLRNHFLIWPEEAFAPIALSHEGFFWIFFLWAVSPFSFLRVWIFDTQKAGKFTSSSAFCSIILSLRKWEQICLAACMWGKVTRKGNSTASKILSSIELRFSSIRFHSSLHLPCHRFHALFYIICWLYSLPYFKLCEGRNYTFIFTTCGKLLINNCWISKSINQLSRNHWSLLAQLNIRSLYNLEKQSAYFELDGLIQLVVIALVSGSCFHLGPKWCLLILSDIHWNGVRSPIYQGGCENWEISWHEHSIQLLHWDFPRLNIASRSLRPCPRDNQPPREFLSGKAYGWKKNLLFVLANAWW